MFLKVNLSSILSMMNNTIRKDGNRAEKKKKKNLFPYQYHSRSSLKNQLLLTRIYMFKVNPIAPSVHKIVKHILKIWHHLLHYF